MRKPFAHGCSSFTIILFFSFVDGPLAPDQPLSYSFISPSALVPFRAPSHTVDQQQEALDRCVTGASCSERMMPCRFCAAVVWRTGVRSMPRRPPCHWARIRSRRLGLRRGEHAPYAAGVRHGLELKADRRRRPRANRPRLVAGRQLRLNSRFSLSASYDRACTVQFVRRRPPLMNEPEGPPEASVRYSSLKGGPSHDIQTSLEFCYEANPVSFVARAWA